MSRRSGSNAPAVAHEGQRVPVCNRATFAERTVGANVTQTLFCYQPTPRTILCEGRTVTAPEPVSALCAELLRAGFAPDTGLVIRAHESGPIIRTVASIAA